MQLALALLSIFCGPLLGWSIAALTNEISPSLPLLVIASATAAAPLIGHAASRSTWLLCLAVGVWLFWGFYFRFGMWI